MDLTKIVRVILDFIKKLFSSTQVESLAVSEPVIAPAQAPAVAIMDQSSALEVALMISSDFEGNSGFAGVVGNFDGMGLTCGALGWPWGLGNQQKLVLKLDKRHKGLIERLMPSVGAEYLSLAKMAIADSMPVISSWSRGANVTPAVKAELAALWGSAPMIEIQKEEALPFMAYAIKEAKQWVGGDDVDLIPLWVICYFFDVRVMNGSLRGITPDDVQAFMDQAPGHSEIDSIFSWCSKVDKTMAAYRDANRNALYWRTMYEGHLKSDTKVNHQRTLFVLGYMRSMMARREYRAATMNRRGIMALCSGYTEGEKKDLSEKIKDYKDILVNLSANQIT